MAGPGPSRAGACSRLGRRRPARRDRDRAGVAAGSDVARPPARPPARPGRPAAEARPVTATAAAQERQCCASIPPASRAGGPGGRPAGRPCRAAGSVGPAGVSESASAPRREMRGPRATARRTGRGGPRGVTGRQRRRLARAPS
jgi:hypothetical protein